MTQLQPAPGIAQTAAALVQILTPDRGGSGFIVNDHGLAITNVHVVGNHREVIVCNAEGQSCQAPVICADPGIDLAALWVTMFPGAASLELADSDWTPVGCPVTAAGYPETIGQHPGMDYTITRGIVSGKRAENGVAYIQTDAATNPGNSGGPLTDDTGRVVGVNTCGRPDRNNIGFAVASNDVGRWLNRNGTRIQSETRQPQPTGAPVIQTAGSPAGQHPPGIATNRPAGERHTLSRLTVMLAAGLMLAYIISQVMPL